MHCGVRHCLGCSWAILGPDFDPKLRSVLRNNWFLSLSPLKHKMCLVAREDVGLVHSEPALAPCVPFYLVFVEQNPSRVPEWAVCCDHVSWGKMLQLPNKERTWRENIPSADSHRVVLSLLGLWGGESPSTQSEDLEFLQLPGDASFGKTCECTWNEEMLRALCFCCYFTFQEGGTVKQLRDDFFRASWRCYTLISSPASYHQPTQASFWSAAKCLGSNWWQVDCPNFAWFHVLKYLWQDLFTSPKL